MHPFITVYLSMYFVGGLNMLLIVTVWWLFFIFVLFIGWSAHITLILGGLYMLLFYLLDGFTHFTSC